MKFFVFPLLAVVVMSVVSCSQTGVVATTNNGSSSPQTSSSNTDAGTNANMPANKAAMKQQALQNSKPEQFERSK
jgi:hypothetical protein